MIPDRHIKKHQMFIKISKIELPNFYHLELSDYCLLNIAMNTKALVRLV